MPCRVVYRRLDELATGQVLVSEVAAANGVVFVAAGERLTPMVIERLRNAALLGQVKGPLLVQEPPAR